MFDLADRMKTIQPSPTLLLNTKATQLRAQGVDIINFSTGEPDFATPQWIQEAAIQAMQQGLTKYTPTDGLPILKEAIQKKMRRDYDLDYDLDTITVGTGAKQIIFNAFLASINPGDEVIIPAPYWVSYPEIVNFCGGISITVHCSMNNNFKITPNQLRENITKRTRWVILNSPNNPTGAVYSKEELFALSEVLMEESHVNILSDDIYELLTYDETHFSSIVKIEPRLKFRTLIVNGVSKSYAMTGWRLGFGAGPADLIKAINMLQSQSTSNPCSITQGAAAAAFIGPQNFLFDWLRIYEERRDVSFKIFSKTPGLNCLLPTGAFYHYINCEGIIGKKTPDGDILRTDKDISFYLLEKAKVAVVSGNSFGLSPYFRMSYTCSIDVLKEGCQRIYDAITALN
ncbi:MAG: pyridoxal phosphate-dependent aminotransferase [Candidatus Paracaedibacteraceae bacterium]|nr:pyridoxal phosphate-dependent aminotransferase [Candidatus Paracaedibacteraceae bacterium]